MVTIFTVLMFIFIMTFYYKRSNFGKDEERSVYLKPKKTGALPTSLSIRTRYSGPLGILVSEVTEFDRKEGSDRQSAVVRWWYGVTLVVIRVTRRWVRL